MTTRTIIEGEDSAILFPFFLLFLLQSQLQQVPNTQTDPSSFSDCNTCHQTPSSIKALFFSESFLTATIHHFNPSTSTNAGVVNLPSHLHPDIRFSPSIYDQLKSLKRKIRHFKLQAMDPLDWRTGRRANRPFENVNPGWLSILHSISPNSYPAPRIPVPDPAQPAVPTAYYLEQAAFYLQEPGPDPFYSEPAPVPPSGPLRVFVYALLSLLLWPLATLVTGAMRLISSVRSVLRLSLLVSLVSSVKSVVGRFKAVIPSWDVVLALVLTSQMVKMLPPIDSRGGVEDWVDTPPLYVLFIPGEEAIRNGAVVRDGIF